MKAIRPLINQEVFIVRSGSWNNSYTRGRVVKVTTGGQVSVQVGDSEQPRRFTKNGYEIGSGDIYGRPYLEYDIAEVEQILADRDEQKRHNKAVSAVLEKINSHKNGFGTFHIDAAAKAELLELVNQL